ncbi:MAG: hypothetical protein QXH21_08165 [Ignisphaera sp.]
MVRGRLASKIVSIGKEIAPQLLVVLTAVLMRLALDSFVVYAQLFQCVDAQSVINLVSAVSTVILIAMIAIVVFLVVFNTIGTVSAMGMKLGEFFLERIRFVFELAVIYLLFFMNLQDAIESQGGCATVNVNKLYTSGPLLFRIIGEVLKWLGLWKP